MTRLESKLAKLQALAADRCNVHESKLAAHRVLEVKARALLAYCFSLGQTDDARHVAERCQAALAGDTLAQCDVWLSWEDVWASDTERAALLAVQP